MIGLERKSGFTIVMADDDADDRFLLEQAFLELGNDGDLRFVKDGEGLIDYLRRLGKYTDPTVSPRPALILLDLNMPKKDGRQALMEIKADPDLQSIPVAIWTTSNEKEERIQCLKIFDESKKKTAQTLDGPHGIAFRWSIFDYCGITQS